MNEVTISKTEGGLKMTHPYILSIDQSTQGTKAMLLDEYGSFLLRRDVPHRQIISDSGWVGHDASEIAANIFRAARLALAGHGRRPGAGRGGGRDEPARERRGLGPQDPASRSASRSSGSATARRSSAAV